MYCASGSASGSDGIWTWNVGVDASGVSSGWPRTAPVCGCAACGDDDAPALWPWSTAVALTTVPGSTRSEGCFSSSSWTACRPFYARLLGALSALASVEPARVMSLCFRRCTSSALRPDVVRPR